MFDATLTITALRKMYDIEGSSFAIKLSIEDPHNELLVPDFQDPNSSPATRRLDVEKSWGAIVLESDAKWHQAFRLVVGTALWRTANELQAELKSGEFCVQRDLKLSAEDVDRIMLALFSIDFTRLPSRLRLSV